MPASVYVCQGGCGTFEENRAEMSARGLVDEKLYCKDCVVVIDVYLKDRDDLHTRLAEGWANGLAALAEQYGVDGRKLPDG